MMSAMSSPDIWRHLDHDFGAGSLPALLALVGCNLAGLVCVVVGEDRQVLDARQNGKAIDPVSIDQRPGRAIEEPSRNGALDSFGDRQPLCGQRRRDRS